MLKNLILFMVLGVMNHILIWFLMLVNLIIVYGSWCCGTMVYFGSGGIEPLFIGGFRGYGHAWLLLALFQL